MSETAHTPGPWEAPGRDGDEWVICTHKSKGKRRTVAHAYSEHDARLIAAAPDMLEALREILSTTVGRGDGSFADFVNEVRDIARAAISKAEGRS